MNVFIFVFLLWFIKFNVNFNFIVVFYCFCRLQWMTTIQFLWPCMIFLTLYTFRWKFNAYDVDDCQFPTRQLLTPTSVLPFFQSYICTIENECTSPKKYAEISEFEDAPYVPFYYYSVLLEKICLGLS